jgi:Na+/H+-dicarboxylate symporter
MKLWQKVIVAMVLGIIVGWMMNANGPLQMKEGKIFLKDYVLPWGNSFISLIKMVVIPLIFFSLISGVTSMTDQGAFKRVGLKAVFAFLTTAVFAVIIGLVFGTVFHPGLGVDLGELAVTTGADTSATKAQDFSLAKLLKDIIPENVVGAMSNNDHILQVVLFAIFTAITINVLGDKVKLIREFCQTAAHLIFKMIEMIMKLAPYGVFCIIAPLVSSQGLGILQDLAVLVITVTCALFLQYLLFGVMIIVFGKMSPMPFYKKMLEAQSFAFSTSSSKATLPTAMRVLNERLGVSKTNTSFVLPLGASINMDGTAIYLGICALFFAQAYGIELHGHQYFLLILTATLGSIGAAGIPGGSILMMGMVFTSVGLPLEGVGVILGIDRILDMLRTTVNITGDSVITLLVDKSEGTFDKDAYYNPDL